MKTKLSVIKAGKVIREYSFTVDKPEDFAKKSAEALDAFRNQYLDILLTDEDVVLKFDKAA